MKKVLAFLALAAIITMFAAPAAEAKITKDSWGSIKSSYRDNGSN